MFREDILVACGFTKDRLLEASDTTVDALKYMLELAFPPEDRQIALKYLLRINCYLAARCCVTQEDRDYVFSQYSLSNWDSAESQNLMHHHRVLALYYLEQYGTARSYIDLCFDKQSDAYKKSFYKRIMEIGFHRSKDQVYFLCHCYNGSYFFDTLLELVTAYNWKCTISTGEPYYPDFVQMITDLVNGKYYALLYKLLFVLGENVQQAKQIILQTQGWADGLELITHFQQAGYSTGGFNSLHARLDRRLYAQTRLFLEFARDIAKPAFYTKRVQSIQKICSQRPPQNTTLAREVSLSLFLLCSQQACTTGSFAAFKELQSSFLDPRYLLEDDFLPTYLRQLTEIHTCAISSMEVESLQWIGFLNIFSPQFKCTAWEENKKQQAVRFLRQEVYLDTFLQNARELVESFSGSQQSILAQFHKSTYLRDLFPDLEFTGPERPVQEKPQLAELPRDTLTMTLIHGKANARSFRFRCDGDDYIGYHIPPGTYDIQWRSESRSSMIEVYNGEPAEGMEVSPDEYPVKVHTLKSATLVVNPGQYITLSGGSHCVLTLLEDPT